MMIQEPKGHAQSPQLAYLLSAWFHQDYDIFGDPLEEILPHDLKSASLAERHEAVSEIERFLEANGSSNENLHQFFEATFEPEVEVEGWDGMTTRQWLEKVKKMIR